MKNTIREQGVIRLSIILWVKTLFENVKIKIWTTEQTTSTLSLISKTKHENAIERHSFYGFISPLTIPMQNRDFLAYVEWDDIIYYKCQSTNSDKLKAKWIRELWELFWVEAQEVVAIPKKLFIKKWYFLRTREEIQINASRIIRELF